MINTMNLQEVDALVQQIRCATCSDYLIRPPIVQLENGTSVCGNCTPPFPPMGPDGTLVRQLTLEQILRAFSFPCSCKSEGCQERLVFGHVNHNKDECVYRPFPCPTEKCPWSGSMFSVTKHFADAHSTLIKNVLNFKLRVDQDSEETVLVVVEKVPFLAKYVYMADQGQLYFKVNCLTLDDALYKIWMFNDCIKDYGISLERNACFPYISQHGSGLTLSLDKYLPVLDNTDCVLVSVEMLIKKGDENDVGPPPFAANIPSN